jgi:STE20-like kinase
MNYKKKTRKRTRKFEVDGVMVTTTTSKVVYGDDDDSITNYHLNRKQELREFKLLQKQEQKQCQDLNLRAHIAFEAQVYILFINIITCKIYFYSISIL